MHSCQAARAHHKYIEYINEIRQVLDFPLSSIHAHGVKLPGSLQDTMIPSLHALTHVLRATTLAPLPPPACPAQPSCLLTKDDQCTITYPENNVITQVFCSPKFYGGDLVPPFQVSMSRH